MFYISFVVTFFDDDDDDNDDDDNVGNNYDDTGFKKKVFTEIMKPVLR